MVSEDGFHYHSTLITMAQAAQLKSLNYLFYKISKVRNNKLKTKLNISIESLELH